MIPTACLKGVEFSRKVVTVNAMMFFCNSDLGFLCKLT